MDRHELSRHWKTMEDDGSRWKRATWKPNSILVFGRRYVESNLGEGKWRQIHSFSRLFNHENRIYVGEFRIYVGEFRIYVDLENRI